MTVTRVNCAGIAPSLSIASPPEKTSPPAPPMAPAPPIPPAPPWPMLLAMVSLVKTAVVVLPVIV